MESGVVPVTPTEKEMAAPSHAVCEEGCEVMVGAVLIVSVAGELVALPQVLVTMQSYEAASAAAAETML
jgi:hypothetical protein